MMLPIQKPDIRFERPPVYDAIRAAGMLFDPAKTIFTYGDAIYNPARMDIPDDLIEHEKVHMRQQREYPGGPKAWWDRYLVDQYFRIDQEAEAYGRQYAFYCKHRKSRDRRLWALGAMAESLAGPTYGNVISKEGAMKLIQQHAV